jgi:predicted nucleic acid-binding protein
MYEDNERNLFRLAAHQEIILLVSEIVILALRDVLERKFPTRASAIDDLLISVPHEVIPAPHFNDLQPLRHLLRHRNDVPILVSALAACADVLITGDSHFHTDAVKSRIRVMRCAEYLAHHSTHKRVR